MGLVDGPVIGDEHITGDAVDLLTPDGEIIIAYATQTGVSGPLV